MSAELLIAGGGPAGAMLAVLAGRLGISTLLFEAARFPRDKACGEGLMPAGVRVLARAGLEAAVGGAPLRGIRYEGFGIVVESVFPAWRPGDRSGSGSPATHGLGQRRLVLDQALLQAARATPHVQVVEGAPVGGVVWRAGRAVGLRVGGREVHGRLIVGADGARSRVRAALGLDAPAAPRTRWGVRVHFRLAPERGSAGDRVRIFVGAGHELYVTPLPAGEVLVAALRARSEPGDEGEGSARSGMPALIASHPSLLELLRGAVPSSAPRGRSPLACRAAAGFVPGALLLGDAAGFTDPITGGGMAQALLSAELLAGWLPRILAQGSDEILWRFDRQRRAMLRDHALLTAFVLSAARRPLTARAVLRFMRAAPAVTRHLVGVAAGTRRLTSVGNLTGALGARP